MTVPFIRPMEANTVGCLATTNQVTIVGRVTFTAGGTVTGVTYIPSGSIAAPASGTGRTYTLYNRSTGAGTTVIATKSVTSNVGMSDNVPFDLTLSTTTASLIVTSGDVLELSSDALTSNAADPGGRLIVTITRATT